MRVKKVVLSLMISLSVLCSVTYAEENITVAVNGENISFDASPRIENERTIVPFRKIFEKLGYSVSWDAGTVTANRGTESIKLQTDSKTIVCNGETKDTPVAPSLIEGRTFVPLRVVAECAGADVEWDADTKTVNITCDVPTAAVPAATAEITVDSAGAVSNSEERDYAVYVTANGKKYHKLGCRTLKNRAYTQIFKTEAEEKGYTPCKICNP